MNFNNLPRPPRSLIDQCVQNVSRETFPIWFCRTYHGQKRIAKLKEAEIERISGYTIGYSVTFPNSVDLRTILVDVSTMCPRREDSKSWL